MADRHGANAITPKDSRRERYASVFKSESFNGPRNKKLLETTTDDFFAVFKHNKVAITEFLKWLHNFALHLGWIAIPIVAPYLWPKYHAKDRRGITREEQETILAREKNAEWKLFLELLWETGAAQSDAANMTAEHIDWQSRTITYFRMKTGSRAQFTISKALEKVLQELPTTGPLFPKLSTFTANDRASRFRRRCHKTGVFGVTLHCYRYAWAFWTVVNDARPRTVSAKPVHMAACRFPGALWAIVAGQWSIET